MESSSDESFVWTKASTGSDDSEEMHLALSNDECDKVIKKEKPDLNNLSIKELKVKKRKHKQESPDEDKEINIPKKKKIKSEPESDMELGKRGKKKKQKEDNYLAMKVKQEREIRQTSKCLKSEKHGELSESINDFEVSSEVDDSQAKKKIKKKKKHKKDITDNDETLFRYDLPNHSENDEIENSKKSPKKKKRKENGLCAQEELNNFVGKELKDNTPVKIKYTKQENSMLEKRNGCNLEDGMETSNYEMDTSVDKFVDNELNQNHDNNITFSEVSLSNEVANNKTHKHSPQRKSRLSDRIKFEDEIDSDGRSETNKTDSNSSHFKRILSENINLQQVSKNSNKNSEITVDDELWILKCPQDIDINKLNNCDFNLDNKSKIKINGETYYGTLNNSEKINILSSSKHEFNIRNWVPNGIIYFRKRLPKPHYNEDNVMVNNQTDFIPLPETKCRHPLFGSNYKDFINVPKTRLNPLNDMSLSSDKKKKKKHKKGQDPGIEVKPKTEYDSETSEKKLPENELYLDMPVKKAKKRKHTNNDGDNAKKSKRVKLEPDSTEAWESEKAIEENLFNF